MSSWICYIQENYQFFDIIIKGAAVGGALISAGIALWSYQTTARKTKYEFYSELYKDFLGDKILTTRTEVASFWQGQFQQTEKYSGLQEVSWLANLSNGNISHYFETYYGLKIADINDDFVTHANNAAIIKKTEQILNKYEHLAKLVEAKVIHKQDIKIFFYTMFADTFVICLPFILYRRKSKPSYAKKMQALLAAVPTLSKSWTRV